MGSSLIMKYGYVTNISNTPTDNHWTQRREIELLDGTIVYGCEGETLTGAVIIGNAEQFNAWRETHTKQDESPI